MWRTAAAALAAMARTSRWAAAGWGSSASSSSRGGGLGLGGLAVISLLFGVDPTQLLNGTDQGGAPATQTTEQNGPRADDAEFQFARRIVGSAEDVWTPILQAKGVQFAPATLTVYDYETPTG